MNLFNRQMDHGGARTIGWIDAINRRALFTAIALVASAASSLGITASAATLDEITYAALPGDGVQIQLRMSEPVAEPLSFAIDNPARVALDFPGVTMNLPRKTENVGVGMARSVTAVEAAGRTRVVLSLIKLAPYKLKVSGSTITITLDGAGATASAAFAGTGAVGESRGALENVDFRRGLDGEGRIIVTLSDPSTVIDTFEQDGKVVVEFLNTELPQRLERRLDVMDFATPVTIVDTFQEGSNVRMNIEAAGVFEHLAYQSDDLFTLEVKPLTEFELEQLKKDKFKYTGNKLSLNFQNIEVRAVLQLLADFTNLNMVVSDTVGGNLTLRLKNVPWDQALDLILKTKGLAMRQTGNVMLVAPTEELAARERLELEAQQQIEELAPLRSEFIQVNYAKASVLSGLLKAEGNSLMTERSNVSVDDRTNTHDRSDHRNSPAGLEARHSGATGVDRVAHRDC